MYVLEKELRRDEKKAFWFGLGGIIAGYDTVEVVCLMGDLNARIGGVKVGEVVIVFRATVTDGSGELMLQIYVQNEVKKCNGLHGDF